MKQWRNFDLQLAVIPVGLVAFGLFVLVAISRWPTSGITISTPAHQAVYAALGLGLMLFFANLDYRLLRSIALPVYIANVGLLLVILAIGHTSYGATRWINIGLLPLQPSEPAKLMLVLVLAKYFSDNELRTGQLRTILTSLIFVLVPLGLVLVQPDLGTSAVFVAIWLGIALMAGIRMRHLALLGAATAVFVPIAWNIAGHMKSFRYARDRLTIFLNPGKDPLGNGYNVIHSQIAVGSGGLLGHWFTIGTQSQLGLLRVEDTDFIFSVIAEQIGFAGVIVLFGILVVLLLRIARVSFMSGDLYGRLLASGIFSMIMFQIFVNVGMNIGLMPVTGIPLPLVSYGGSSLITTLASFGILQSILLRHKKLVFAPG